MSGRGSTWVLHPGCSLVFDRYGHPIRSIRYAWEMACAATGLTGKIPDDFRRTAVRNMVRLAIPERVAMQMKGHRTRDVFERYNIVSQSDLQEGGEAPRRGFCEANGYKFDYSRPGEGSEAQ